MPTESEILLSLRDWSLVRRVPMGERFILSGIDLELHAGSWLVVLGTNGSGKSSLLKYLASDESPLADDAAIVFQDPDDQIIASTVNGEISLGRSGLDVEAQLADFGLAGLGSLKPGVLSAGQKQRLALAVAVSGSARMLLCDEPTALQDDAQAGWILDRLDSWRRVRGRTLVTATCDRRELARADELLLLREGKAVLAGPVADNLDHPLVTDLLGERGDGALPAQSLSPPAPSAGFDGGPDPVLELRGIDCRFSGPGNGFAGVDLVLRPGERLGITGPNGCGKSTLLGLCAGVRPPDAGQVVLSGRGLYDQGRRNLDHGQALLAPQFPEYLFTRSTVAQEISLDPVLSPLDKECFLADLGLPDDLLDRNPHDLSTGQKRRLALGLVILSHRPLVLLDEPTAALDRAGKRQVLDLMARMPADTALLIASHDREFLAMAGCRLVELTPGGLKED